MSKLAVLGGKAIRTKPWPIWPRFDRGTETQLVEVLQSGRWTISGPYRGKPSKEREFSANFARYHGSNFCTPVTSGTMGLTISLLALGIGYGDEVIVPGQTWVACASAEAAVGAVPVLADVNIETLCISPDQISKLIGPKTKAIIVVHAFCKVAPINDIVHIATQSALKVIEDCSQAHGAELNGKKVGTFGDVGVFSFQQSKVLTSGEGGAVITNNEETSVLLEQLRADGRIFTQQSKLNHLELEERGQVLGQNFCLSEFQSAVLSDRLTHLDRENAKRRANARYLSKLLDGIEGVHSTTVQAGELETYYNYVFQFSDDVLNNVTSNQLAAAISEEINIQVAPAYVPMNRH